MAFQLALRNNVAHPFSSDNKAAGWKWLRLFLQRNPTLSARKPQAMSLARVQGLNEESVNLFFSILKPELEKIKFNPLKVFNVDETGITVVQHKVRKIVAMKGKKSVHKLSAERGALVTVVMCMSASGSFVPPLMIFPRKLMKNELMDGAPPGAIGAANESGWITSDLFEKWFQHFISIVKPSKEDPIVLILDGHYSHSCNLNLLNLACDNGVPIVCLPPHSTSKLQPLDVSFMFPFKTYYAQAIENWLSNYPNRVVCNLQIAQLFNEAYAKAEVVKTAVNGFKKTGILPYNPNVFGPEDFLATPPAEASSAPEPSAKSQPSTSTDIRPASPSDQPSCSTQIPQLTTVSPRDIVGVPVIHPSTSKRRGNAALLTSSPYKKKLQDSKEKIDLK
ncbi:tigger transposable element-derived protein 6-like, partial [Nilaparvata lugens]|uniref:tigger transposable element-derived protein 6-like n=1 Tax=Nilaparvata lugens TaxID=108931 RepID=UPI00193E99AA